MPTDAADSEHDRSIQIPFEAQVGVALVSLVYGVAVLSNTIQNQIPAVVWFAAAAGLLGYAVHQVRFS